MVPCGDLAEPISWLGLKIETWLSHLKELNTPLWKTDLKINKARERLSWLLAIKQVPCRASPAWPGQLRFLAPRSFFQQCRWAMPAGGYISIGNNPMAGTSASSGCVVSTGGSPEARGVTSGPGGHVARTALPKSAQLGQWRVAVTISAWLAMKFV